MEVGVPAQHSFLCALPWPPLLIMQITSVSLKHRIWCPLGNPAGETGIQRWISKNVGCFIFFFFFFNIYKIETEFCKPMCGYFTVNPRVNILTLKAHLRWMELPIKRSVLLYSVFFKSQMTIRSRLTSARHLFHFSHYIHRKIAVLNTLWDQGPVKQNRFHAPNRQASCRFVAMVLLPWEIKISLISLHGSLPRKVTTTN